MFDGNPSRYTTVLLNDGSGAFAVGAPVDVTGRALVLGDISGDGRPDLLFAEIAGLTIVRNDGDGTFTDVTTVFPGEASGLAAVDLDGDDDTDVILEYFGEGLTVGLNTAGTLTFGPFQSAATSNTLALGDFDGDGDTDAATVRGRLFIYDNDGAGVFTDARASDGTPTNVALPDEEIARITNLVREAVGYNADRGDTINAASGAFADEGSGAAPPPWKDPEIVALGKDGLNWLLVLIAILFAYFGVIRPLLRTAGPPKPKEEKKGAAAGEEGVRVTLSGETGEGEEPETFEQRLERARAAARNDLKMVANLIKDWMGMNEEARK